MRDDLTPIERLDEYVGGFTHGAAALERHPPPDELLELLHDCAVMPVYKPDRCGWSWAFLTHRGDDVEFLLLWGDYYHTEVDVVRTDGPVRGWIVVMCEHPLEATDEVRPHG